MATTVDPATAFAWPEDVLRYATEHHFEQELPAVLAMTRRVFPEAHHIEVTLNADAELHDTWFVTFDVTMAGLTVDEADARWQEWHRLLPSGVTGQPGGNVVLLLDFAAP